MKALHLLALAAFAPVFAGMSGAADISGTVQGKGAKPIEGATVRVYAACMRTGSSPMCGTCWPDCRKSARTGPDGRYQIAGVSDALVFDLLVLADGHAPAFVGDIDPRNATPANAVLKPRDISSIPPTLLTQGRVVGPDGHPIAGAVVKSVSPQVERMTITDADGRFALVWTKPAQNNWLHIQSEGWCAAHVESKARRGISKPVEVKLTRGVTIMGRVLDASGKPAAHVKMGAIQTERSFTKDLPVVEAETGKDGSFFLFNVPAHDELAVYGLMESLAGRGALPIRVVQTGADEETVQTKDFVIQRACTLSGQFLLPNGMKFTAESRVNIGRSVAWDSQIVDVNPDGRFEAGGLPPGEIIELVPPRDLPDIHPGAVSHAFDIDVGNMCVQRLIKEDVTDLKIELVKKDSNKWQEECRRRGFRIRHEEFLQEASLSPEQQEFMITALVRQEDAEIAAANAPSDWDAKHRAAAAEFEKEVRRVLGDQVFQKFTDLKYLQTGKHWVTSYLDGRRGETLTAAEKAALIRSIGHHMDHFYKNDGVDEGQTLAQEPRHQWHNRQYDILLTSGKEVLPPTKLTYFLEWVEKDREAKWESIKQAYEK
jgi:hypothetical protein